ncbi:MAG: hypothetical protein HYX69_02105 [Planctomycetia bacterium]|nr:hypothetical protein [Planctomycetia bacterium]
MLDLDAYLARIEYTGPRRPSCARFCLAYTWRELIVERGESVTTRALMDDDEILAVLDQRFGLRFPPGTRFPYQDAE